MTDAGVQASLTGALLRLAEPLPEDGAITLDDLIAGLGTRAFGATLFALALPCCIPFLYGVPQIVALPMAALAGQMTLGRPAPWLPRALGARTIPAKGFKRVAQWGRHWLGPFERLARPRFEQLAGRRAERAIGVALSVFCVSILTPLPLTNSAPGFAVALTAIGLAERDGLFVGIGLVFGTLWIAGLIGLAVFGVGALGALF